MVKKVLIVDDDAAICRALKKKLEATGKFEVSFCTNSTEAFQEARKQQPDVIFLDVEMPELSGPEVAEQLEENEDTWNIPFVYLTGIVEPSEVEERKNLIGGNYFVAKPFRTSELLRVLDMVLKESSE